MVASVAFHYNEFLWLQTKLDLTVIFTFARLSDNCWSVADGTWWYWAILLTCGSSTLFHDKGLLPKSILTAIRGNEVFIYECSTSCQLLFLFCIECYVCCCHRFCTSFNPCTVPRAYKEWIHSWPLNSTSSWQVLFIWILPSFWYWCSFVVHHYSRWTRIAMIQLVMGITMCFTRMNASSIFLQVALTYPVSPHDHICVWHSSCLT